MTTMLKVSEYDRLLLWTKRTLSGSPKPTTKEANQCSSKEKEIKAKQTGNGVH